LEGICFFHFPFPFFHQAAPKFDHLKDQIGRISIDLPKSIFITIETHGKGVH
jgi:hypothetical protein